MCTELWQGNVSESGYLKHREGNARIKDLREEICEDETEMEHYNISKKKYL
jgi:hypothetical protein